MKRIASVFVLYAMMAAALPAQTYTSLLNFADPDGASPKWALVQGTNGDLYGTTAAGGAGGDDPGTVFKITPGGTLTSLYSFCSQSGCTDGFAPAGGLVLATNGDFYGVTYSGGANCGSCGTVFRITPSGTLNTIYSFCSQTDCADGKNPNAGLVQATNGDLYGITSYGGNTNQGTVFKITPSGALTTLVSFNGADGLFPSAALIQATNGYLYGTTSSGGANCAQGCGTVFRMTPSGALTTLYSFCSQTNCTDGEYPSGPLVQAANGNLYGTTELGGANGKGTIFEITTGGTFTTIYSFCSQSGCTDGTDPQGALVQAEQNGDLYGTTAFGGQSCGSDGCGTIFKITPSGTLTTLFRNFCAQTGCPRLPYGGLVQYTSGEFFGTTFSGGTGSAGTVFTLSAGLGPFVETLPTSGAVGSAVKILGTNLSSASSITFNGTPATFTVVSSAEITTTVPAGATTGRVQVGTTAGTLSSNVPFQVP
jgi:uncharacterized repeat protein (TIGR03803 family)